MINKNLNLEIGMDALEFLETIPADKIINKKILLNWDPPYYDLGNPDHEEMFNKRKKRFIGSKDNILMDPIHRKKIYDYAILNFKPTYISYFHNEPYWNQPDFVIYNLVCYHYWIKTKAGLSGNGDPNNVEWIYILTANSDQVDSRRIYTPRALIHDPIYKNQFNSLDRSTLAKPYGLMSDIVKHLQPEIIIDPFAGRGEIIKVALEKDILIYASDKDLQLKARYNKYKTSERIPKYKQIKLEEQS